MFKDMTDEEKKKYWIEHNKRSIKRRRLKNEIAEFATTLQTRRGYGLDKKAIMLVNDQLKEIVNLRYKWTDKDLERARRILNELSKKYLQQPFYKIPSDKATVMTECLSILDKTDMDTAARVDVLYDLLQMEVQKLYLHGADSMEPTPKNALLFLTQDMQYTMPQWFHKALIKLLEEKYKGKDFTEFMKEIRNQMQMDKMHRSFKSTANEAIARENKQK